MKRSLQVGLLIVLLFALLPLVGCGRAAREAQAIREMQDMSRYEAATSLQ